MAGSYRGLLVAAAAAAVLLGSARAPASVTGRDGHAAGRPERLGTEEAGVEWRAMDVRATLDRDGVLHVSERLTLAVTGQPGFMERMFRRWIRREVTVRSIALLDPPTGAAHALARGRPDTADRYEVEEGTLRWSLPGPGDPAGGPGTNLTYELEYTVAGAVIPIWGVRAFGTSSIVSPFVLHPLERAGELWKAWRLAPGGWSRRYLLDHDFSPFPFLGGAPIGRFSLNLRVDPAWRLLATPGADRAPVAAAEDLRDFLPLDFTGPGTPAAVDRTMQIVWMAPLLVLPAVSALLVGRRLAGMWSLKRQLDRVPVDEHWIRQQMLSRPPPEVRRLAGEAEGLDPEKSARQASDASRRSGFSLAARARATPSVVLTALGVVLPLSALDSGGFQALATGLVLGSVVCQLAGPVLRGFARSPELPLFRLASLLGPLVLFPVGAIGFFLTVPGYPIVLVGLASLWLGLTNVLVNTARLPWSEHEVELRYGLVRARQYIAAELGKTRPALDDAWLPWILALGLEADVENWRRGRGMFATRPAGTGEAATVRWTGGSQTDPPER